MDQVDHIQTQWARQKPELDTAPMALIGRMQRIAIYQANAMAESFAAHGLIGPSFDVLATLFRAGPPHALTPNALLATMMITSGTMTNRIDQLVKQGLVKRLPCEVDRRSVKVQLTGNGRELFERALVDHAVTQARLVAGLTPAQREALNELLTVYLEALEP